MSRLLTVTKQVKDQPRTVMLKTRKILPSCIPRSRAT